MDQATNGWAICPPDDKAKRSNRINPAAADKPGEPSDRLDAEPSTIARIRWTKAKVAHVIASR